MMRSRRVWTKSKTSSWTHTFAENFRPRRKRRSVPFIWRRQSRRAKVEFAAALAGATRATSATGAANAAGAGAVASATIATDVETRGGSWLNWLRAPHLALQWGFALAALVIATVAGYLIIQNHALVAKIAQVQSLQATLDSRQKDLQAQIDASDSTPAAATDTPEAGRKRRPSGSCRCRFAAASDARRVAARGHSGGEGKRDGSAGARTGIFGVLALRSRAERSRGPISCSGPALRSPRSVAAT